jgi:hypothetical protein
MIFMASSLSCFKSKLITGGCVVSKLFLQKDAALFPLCSNH